MINDLIELLGVILIGVFAYFVWWPLPILVAGVFLILAANARAIRSRRRTEAPNVRHMA